MKILIVSTSDIGHGAGVAAHNLLNALKQAGYDAKMLVAEKLSDNDNVHEIVSSNQPWTALIKSQFERFMNIVGPQNVYSANYHDVLNNPLLEWADVIHLHNIHWHRQNFSPALLPELSKTKPVIWTFHDMWPFTGHCIYSGDCLRWKEGCGKCPDLKSYIRLMFDSTALLCKIKKRIYSKSKFIVSAPSRWLVNLATESPLLKHVRITHIPNGVDQEIFFPHEKVDSRKSIGINDPNKDIVLFASSLIDDVRKGYIYFEEAMCRLYEKRDCGNIVIVAAGKGKVSDKLKKRFFVKEMGYVSDRQLMASIYSASDIFVMPSILDNLPNVILESLACGTPVVCFNTCGMPDMIQHGINGYLALNKDPKDLMNGIEDMIWNKQKRQFMQSNCVSSINQGFKELHQVGAFIKVYNQIIADKT